MPDVYMNLIERLQNLYDKEINFKIECSWDNGFRVCLGDELNGYNFVGAGFYYIKDAIEKLVMEAGK